MAPCALEPTGPFRQDVGVVAPEPLRPSPPQACAATPGAAEDFAQDAVLTVWRKADLFDARKARAATWIFTIARNRRLDMLRA
ncbi:MULTISPECIES: sigma factor [unclassified Brevundimonas]|uniref:sigma factor n=1 Tax=unclassified Brevundimonas TaxID=2622653 RepID=UPI003F8E1001